MEAGQPSQKPKKPASPVIIVVLALIFMIWLMLLFTDKTIYEDYGMDLNREVWVYIGSVIMIALICILLVTGFPARMKLQEMAQAQTEFISSQPQGVSVGPAVIPAPTTAIVTETQPLQAATVAVVEAEPLVVEAEVVEAEIMEEVEEETQLKTKKPRLIEFPRKVPGGVYGDTIVRVDPRTKLNLRTLLVRSCMICDRQGKCWEEIMDSIPRDDFLGNIECKKGLRRLKSGKREGEPSAKLKRKKIPRVKTVEMMSSSE